MPTGQRVWSPWLRLMHWVLAASTIAAFATHEGGGRWHEWIGYVALGTAVLRIVLGLPLGGRWAFGGFVHSVSATWAYARSVWRRTEARHIGHNPLGGWMVVVLLANAVATGFTGWLFTTDRFWGTEWLEELHGALGEAFVPLVALHLAGVALSSWRHRENLVGAMLHGHKREAAPGDVN